MECFLQSVCQVRFDVDWDRRFVFGHCNTLQLGQKTQVVGRTLIIAGRMIVNR